VKTPVSGIQVRFGECCDPGFIETWNAVRQQMADEQQIWIANLREQGVKAAHPDDGWVNRKENFVYLEYCQYNDGLKVGDVLALGWPGDHRLVRITEKEEDSMFGQVYWHFEPVTEGAR
jgi:hypothetical protein